MISMLLISLIVPVFAFLFESYPRFLNRKVGVDIWTHLLYLKEYHKQKGIPKKIEGGFLVSGVYDYPPIFITILSKLPFRLVEKYEFLFSPFFDALHVLVIFFVAFFITENVFIALGTQFLYALTPIIVIENSSATPRSLGYLLFTLVFMSLFFYIDDKNILFLLASILFGSLIFLAHRFTAQGFLFFSLFFSIIERNFLYLFIFLVSFLLAIIFSKGFYLTVLMGHLGNLSFWKKNIDYRFAHQVRGNSKKHQNPDFVFRVYNKFLQFPPFVLAITNPWTLPVFYLIAFYQPSVFLYQQLAWWVGFSYILALLVIWIRPLRFLGEGQRYLELSAFPSAFLSSVLLASALQGMQQRIGIVVYLCIAILCMITVVVIQRKAVIKDRMRTLTPDLDEMFLYLRDLKNKPRLLCIPHQITTSTIYHTGCQVFVNADYKNISQISDVYPYIKMPVDKIMRKYNLEGILLNENYSSVDDLKMNNPEIIKRCGSYVYLKFK